MDLGAGSGHLAKFLDEDMLTGRLIQCDTSSNALYRDVSMSTTLPLQQRVDRVLLNAKQMEGVEALPFDEGSVDAVLSSMSLHWVNDLPCTCGNVVAMLPSFPITAVT